MPTTRKRGATATVAALVLLLGTALSGCSLSRDDDADKRDTASPPTATPTPTDEASETPSATPTPTATPSASSPAKPAAALLTGDELPPLNASSPWTEKQTTSPGPTSFGVCQRFDMLSIGAMSAVERRFTGATSDTAAQQVVEYPDAQNTVRASKVLEAWHDNCRSQVNGGSVKVGPITSLAVPRGKGWWYTVSWTKAGAGHFHTFGMAYDRNRMTLLKMDHAGQDHDYPPGQDPMELAVEGASAKM